MTELSKLKSAKQATLFAIITALGVLVYVGFLKAAGANTIIWQLLGTFAITLGAMFIAIQPFTKNLKQFDIGSPLKISLFGGAGAAALLIVIELILVSTADIKMAPTSMLDSGLPYGGLQAMLMFEVFVYSIISGIAAWQLYKKPTADYRYERKPKTKDLREVNIAGQ